MCRHQKMTVSALGLPSSVGLGRRASAVALAQPAGPDNSLLAVAPVHEPLRSATQALVRDLRAIHAPVYVGVAGETAAYIDLDCRRQCCHVQPACMAATLTMTFSIVLSSSSVELNSISRVPVLNSGRWPGGA